MVQGCGQSTSLLTPLYKLWLYSYKWDDSPMAQHYILLSLSGINNLLHWHTTSSGGIKLLANDRKEKSLELGSEYTTFFFSFTMVIMSDCSDMTPMPYLHQTVLCHPIGQHEETFHTSQMSQHDSFNYVTLQGLFNGWSTPWTRPYGWVPRWCRGKSPHPAQQVNTVDSVFWGGKLCFQLIL